MLALRLEGFWLGQEKQRNSGMDIILKTCTLILLVRELLGLANIFVEAKDGAERC